jgi:transcriptional regulator with XRE-family HTH domain
MIEVRVTYDSTAIRQMIHEKMIFREDAHMAQALKVDPDLYSGDESRPSQTSHANRRGGGRRLTLDKISPSSKGAPVAKYIFPYAQASGVSVKELSEALGYDSHNNVSMYRTGAARMPIGKAPVIAEVLNIPNRYEFGLLVAENNMPDNVEALKEMGVICTQQERNILDVINEHVPLGDRADFLAKLETALKQDTL